MSECVSARKLICTDMIECVVSISSYLQQSRDSLSPVQVLPSLTALTELDVSSNKEAGGVVHSLVSALPLTQMRHLPLNSCSLNEESFTAVGTHTLLLMLPQLVIQLLPASGVHGGGHRPPSCPSF